MVENTYGIRRSPVPAAEVCIESVGVRALDRRRVDLAVDLTPCRDPLTVEAVILGPDSDELSSIVVVQTRDLMLDRIMHLRCDAIAGDYTLHVGVFCEGVLVARATRCFQFPNTGSSQ